MKTIKLHLLSLLLSLTTIGMSAQSLGDILGKITSGNTGDILENVIEGVFSSSNITVADLVGSYVSEGPAVTFKSENLLQKAGGIAGAAAIENKLAPYYEQYGLTGMTLEIDNNANFSMKIKGITLKGTITKNEGDGTFQFNVAVMGMTVGKFTAYIEKSLSTIKVMFDGDKLLKLISTVAKFTGNSIASAMGSILDSYDGACIGFKMAKTGSSTSGTSNAPAGSSVTNSSTTGTSTSTPDNSTNSSSSSSSSTSKSGIGSLLDLIKKK